MRFAYALSLALLLGACASTADLRKVDERLTDLDAEFVSAQSKNKAADEQLRLAQDSEIRKLRVDLASLGNRIESIERKVQILEGRTEEVPGKINVSAQRLSDVETGQQQVRDSLTQLDARVAAMEKVLVGGAPSREAFDEDSVYKKGYEAHLAGDYDTARREFERLLREAPQSKLAPNAEFWLAEGFYKRKEYGDALSHYSTVLEKYPESNKRCSALLKTGIVLEELKEKQKAQPFYSEVLSKCADQPEAKEAKARSKK